jgi:hypothetical protein
MAGKIQKPYEQLQNKRGGRRRGKVVFLPAAPLTPEDVARRDAALNVAIGEIGRAFGRGKIPKVSTIVETPRERPKRKYRPKAEQTRTPAKAEIAAARPRDAKGHFLPLPDSRRARIRAANAALPEALRDLVGDEEQLLADLAQSRGTDDAAWRVANWTQRGAAHRK